VHVVTTAGKEYFKMLQPFRASPLVKWEDFATAKAAITADIKARTDVVYQQLLRWPQVPFGSQQGGM
jgi:hypothetical protein